MDDCAHTHIFIRVVNTQWILGMHFINTTHANAAYRLCIRWFWMQTHRFGARVVVAFLILPLRHRYFMKDPVLVLAGFFSDLTFRHLFSVTGCARVSATPGIYHFSRRGNISREQRRVLGLWFVARWVGLDAQKTGIPHGDIPLIITNFFKRASRE